MARALDGWRTVLSAWLGPTLSESKVKFNEQSAYGIAGLVPTANDTGPEFMYLVQNEEGGSNNENPGRTDGATMAVDVAPTVFICILVQLSLNYRV